MNVLFISTSLYPCKVGGVELFNYHLIKALAVNHNLWIITSCSINFNQKNINLVKINPKKIGSRKLSIIFEHSKNILKLRDKVEIIHVPYTSRSWLYACYIPLIKKLYGLRYILSLHGGAMLPWRPKFLHKFLFQHAGAIIAVSDTMKREYEQRSGKEITVIPPVIPFKKSAKTKIELKKKYGFYENEKIILSLGSIKKIKGSDIILNAFFLLGKNYIERHSVKIIFVGDGIMRRNLEDNVKKCGFEKYINFLGSIKHEEVPDIYKLADIYIIASLYEGTPLSLLEAMFNGLPIIGSDVRGINNIILDGENGLLFEKNNSLSLMTKIKKLLDNIKLMMDLGMKTEKYFKDNFNFEDTLNGHLKLYEQVARRII